MTITLILLGILVLVGVVATVLATARDGYRRAPLRTDSTLDPEARFAAPTRP